jgi:hypothetical protein
VITFTGPDLLNGVNGLQLRDITPAAPVDVPEPSSLALLALGGGALAGWRRWRKREQTA